MRYKIDRFIRTHQAITIALVTSLILIQLCLSCTKEDKSTHYLKMVGSCQQTTSVKIFDETGGLDPYGQPVDTINNQHFKNYVNTISKHIFAKIDKIGQCQGNSRENPEVELVFVYRPAISRGIASYKDSPAKSQDNRYLDSPWVKLSLDKSHKLNMHAVFVWNERQFLYDQALIFRDKISDIKPLLPIDLETFKQWDRDYDNATPAQKADLVKQLPADILWLFQYWQIDDLGSPSWESGMRGLKATIDTEKIGYIDLNKTLINEFFTSTKTERHYGSILDLKDIFNIEKYQIGSFNKGDVKHLKDFQQ
jgi:hypothetical protein